MKKVLVFVLLFSVVFASPSLPAQEKKDEDSAVKLQEVVVTATRDRQETRKTPANVTVITAEEIEKSGATNVPQLLEFIEGVQLRSYSGNQAQAMIDLRGFGGDNPYGKTLILLDGRRLNRPDMSPASLMQIPLNNIESIEIIRGASSVLYGDAAIGGVINIITKRGKGAPQINAALTGGSYSFHDEKVGVSGSAGKLSYAVNGANQFSWGYRDRSKFSFSGAGFNLGYDASSYLFLSLDGSLSKTAFEMPGGLTKAQMEANPRQIQPGHINDDATEDYQNLHGKINSFLGKFGRLDTDFYYGNKEIESNYQSSWWPNQYSSNNIQTFGVTPKYILETPLARFANKVIVGVDYYHETMTLDRHEDKERTVEIDTTKFEKKTLGFYLRDEFNILPSLILAGGYRTESAAFKGSSEFSPDLNKEKKHHAQAWEGSLTYLSGQKSKVYAKYASVYRYPFLDEQASFYVPGSVTFNMNIEKERGKSYEVGTVVYPLDNLKLGLTLYRIDMEDEISADPVTYELKNLDKTRHVGAEFNFNYLWKDYFNVNGNLTYQKAVFDEGVNDGKEVPLVPHWMTNANLEIYLPYNISLNPRLRYVSKSFLANDYDNNAEKLQDYLRCDFYIYWRPEIKGRKVVVFAGVENLTDEKYATYGLDLITYGLDNTYYPADGLTIKSGVSVTF